MEEHKNGAGIPIEQQQSAENQQAPAPAPQGKATENTPASPTKPQSSPSGEPKKKSVDPEKQRKQNVLKFSVVMILVFLGCLWLIFSPSKSDKEKEKEQSGINTEVPEGKGVQIADSKQQAQDQVRHQNRDGQRVRSLGDDSFGLLGPKTSDGQEDEEYGRYGEDENAALTATESSTPVYQPRGTTTPHRQPTKIEQSQQAYADVNAMLNGFYKEPAKDPKLEQLEKELEQMKKQLATAGGTVNPIDYMEKSYELAARYFPQHQQETPATTADGREPAVAVRRVPDRTVSALIQQFDDDKLRQILTEDRNIGFHTPVGDVPEIPGNAIRAVVDQAQTLTNGSPVKLRLKDGIMAGEIPVPAGALIVGHARVNGQRLDIEVSSIEYGGSIIPVSLFAHDLDGQRGLFIPDSQERNALNNAAAGMAGTLGSGITISRNAGQQVISDLVRSAITGGSQYLSTKLREVKVSVKANYQLLLVTKE